MIQISKTDRLVLPLLLAALAGCENSKDRAPFSPAEQPGFDLAIGVDLLVCPTEEEVTASATIDSLGGTLRVTDGSGGRHEVLFPAGSVLEPTVFTLTAPASQNVVVQVTATDPVTGEEKVVGFPVEAEPSLAISVKRCPPSEVDRPDLQLYQVNELTNAPITSAFGAQEPVLPLLFGARNGGTPDVRVRGEVPHFSAYAVGGPERGPADED